MGDAHAKKIASTLFKETPVLLKKNPYFKDTLKEFKRLKQRNKIKNKKYKKALYVTEPILYQSKLTNKTINYNEYDALLYFLNNINAIDASIKELTIRPHPSENKEKYNWVKKISNIKINVSKNNSLINDIHKSDLVAGCESMAMVIGILGKKRVVTSIPHEELKLRNISLPYKGIEKISEIIERK